MGSLTTCLALVMVTATVDRSQNGNLHVHKGGGNPETLSLVALEPAPVNGPRYLARTRIRYEGVEGTAYLEMWNQFRNAKGSTERYFTRTLAAQGPTASFTGTGDWRVVELPFDATDGGDLTLERLEFNLHLPGKGAVTIEPFVVESGGGAWWDPGTGGMVGGFLGAFLGILLGVAGTLAGKGRGRGLALGAAWVTLALGIVSLLAGVVAFATSQPYGVWYPLVLLGALSCVMGPMARKMFLRRFEAFELRRMQAMDA